MNDPTMEAMREWRVGDTTRSGRAVRKGQERRTRWSGRVHARKSSQAGILFFSLCLSSSLDGLVSRQASPGQGMQVIPAVQHRTEERHFSLSGHSHTTRWSR